jgi:hypothetical protein
MSRTIVLTLSLLLALLVGSVSAMVAAEGDVVFGEPQASGAFGAPVEFSTAFRSEQQPRRVELLTRLPGQEGESVDIASVTADGDGTWTASAFRGGHIVPNTTWEYRFRAITDDGVIEGPSASHRLRDERFEWQVLEGDRVNVWWYDGNEGFGRRALDIAEEALASSSELLGVGKVEPVDFFIYSETKDFRQAMGPATRENTAGQAHPTIRTLFALINRRQIDSDWVEEVVTHELAHLVFHDAVDNPYQYPPRWLNEGVAVYVSDGYDDGDRSRVQGAAGGGTIMPLEGLGGHFPTRTNRISLAYAESVSAVDYLVETYGEDQLVELITSFADGTGLDAAFMAATGSDFAAFDEAWLTSLGADLPEPYGPQPVSPGPLPEAWATEASALLR